MPFGDFIRKDVGNGAPNDGLVLTEMWGFGFRLPAGSSDAFYVDQIRY